MLIKLHSQATTTPKIRAAIQASDEPAWVLAERHGTTEQTVWKWRKRDSVEDRSHTPHHLQTTLTPAQEAVAVALRKTLLVSLDDLLAVVREFLNPNASRSGLDRCLRRHGVGNLRDMKARAPKPKHSAFKAYEPGYIHIDVKYLPQMADETSRRYLFVAIDRATRWVFIRIFKAKTAANARRFLRDLERACPIRIRTILTDNGKEFTDRLFGLRKRAETGEHEFDKLCADLDIEHRLTPPKSPQTNGMVERFNGRIEEVLQSHHFRSGEELEATLHRYVWLYNQQLPQSALRSKPPLQAMKDWYKIKPELFKKRPHYLPGCDIYEHSFETECLECIACYRSRPSDALGEHRAWKVGEGHVGKAFELQRELICGDSSAPDIKPWISASPANFDERDDERYVSLAAVPIGVNADEPIGVLIVTSNVPMRFANSDENHGDENMKEERRLAVAALQDFAAQFGQLVAVFRLREATHAEGVSGDE